MHPNNEHSLSVHDKLVEALRKIADIPCNGGDCPMADETLSCFECEFNAEDIANSALAAAGEEVEK